MASHWKFTSGRVAFLYLAGVCLGACLVLALSGEGSRFTAFSALGVALSSLGVVLSCREKSPVVSDR